MFKFFLLIDWLNFTNFQFRIAHVHNYILYFNWKKLEIVVVFRIQSKIDNLSYMK
jgi:hypothetical protein